MITEIRKGVLDYVPPDIIDTNWCLLRHVEPSTIEYQDLKNSIKERGVLETILIRRIKKEGGEVTLSLIDGLNRLTASRELSLQLVPCNILDNVDDDEALCLQVQANLFQIQTKKADFAKALKILVDRNKDTMSMANLSKITNCRVSYLRDLLKLTKLPEEIQQFVNEGIINVRNAILLAQLPYEEMFDWVEMIQKRPRDFKELAESRIRELRTRTLKKNEEDDGEWEPAPIMRKKLTIEAEIETPKIVKQLVTQETTPDEAFKLGLMYALSIDPLTVKDRRDKRQRLIEEDEAIRKQGVKKRAEERMKVLEMEMEELRKKTQ